MSNTIMNQADINTLNNLRARVPKVNRLNNIPVVYNEEGLILLEF